MDKIGDDVSTWKVYKLDEVLEENGITSTSLSNEKFRKFYFENADKIWQRGRNTSIPDEILKKSRNNWETVFEYGDNEDRQYCYKGRRMAFLENVLKDCVSKDGQLERDLGTLICDFWDHVSTAALFSEGGISFPNGKKPQLLLITLIRMFTNDEDLVLDFFSGSASTAEAVMRINAYDNKNNKFIMAQIPENLDNTLKCVSGNAKKDTNKLIKFLDSIDKPHLLTEIGKERIRRAGKKILEENKDKEGIENLDIGFRVLKTDSSNMKDVYYSPVNTQQSLLDSLTDNIKEDRTAEDLLFQIMLDLGISLSSKIDVKEIKGKNIFSVEDGFLIACFDKDITEETVKAIAEEQPYYAIFRDASIADDSVATNIEQIFETLSPQTVRKVI